MLRRAKSNRLSRRKSTSSIPTKHEHIDPEVARQQAQAAATYAFARAYARANTEIQHSVEVFKSNNMVDQRQGHIRSDGAWIENPGVRRQHSVRFTGPDAIRQRPAIGTKVLRNNLEGKVSNASLRPRAITNNTPVPAAYRPPSRSSSIGKATVDKGTAQSIVTALAAYDEYYTREEDIVSTPSSYRRMRRSKSTRTLSSPSRARKALSSDITTENDYNARIWNRVPWIPSQQYQQHLRGPKSMSFLRGGKDYMTPAVREDHDNAVQMARDKFLHQIEQQRLKEQPSFLFRAKPRREGKTFRQSIRNGSTSSYGNPIGSTNQVAPPKEGTLRIKARKASWTIKRRLKELFGRKSDQSEGVEIPDQQVEAHASHRRISCVPISEVQRGDFENVPRPDSAAISRVASRQPSLHSMSSRGKLHSLNGSVRSQRSEGSGRSRVTSWTSTADNTATSRHTQAEREAQRLSIIQENGTHISSASLNGLRTSNQLSAYPMLNRPRSTHRRGNAGIAPVDSKMVYSALMKRLDDNSLDPKPDVCRRLSDDGFVSAFTIPPRSQSVTSHNSGRLSRAPGTIRHVQEDADMLNDGEMRREGTITSLPHEDDDVFSPKPLWNVDTSLTPYHSRNRSNTPRSSNTEDVSYTTHPLLGSSDGLILPPQQQAARNERLMKLSKPPRETRSTFFGTSSFTAHRSTSPYRRILAEADYSPITITGDAAAGNRILFAPPVVRCSDPEEFTAREQLNTDGTYTESVYSRTTSGQVPAEDSAQSLALVQDNLPNDNSGSVTLTDLKLYQPTGPTRDRKTSSSPVVGGGSLRGETRIIDKSGGVDEMITVNYALPSMPKYFGHFREHAQITEDGTEISQPRVRKDKQPVGMLQQKVLQTVTLKPILKRKSSTSLDGFPMPPPPPPPLPPPLPPLIPLRSPLRLTQPRASQPSLDSISTYHQPTSATASVIKQEPLNDHQLLRPISLTSINRMETPAKLVKRTGRPSNNHYDASPGIGAAVEKQFGSVGSKSPYSGVENCVPANIARAENHGRNDIDHVETDDGDAQASGSRVMVDMFLSSRRKRVAGSDESNAFL